MKLPLLFVLVAPFSVFAMETPVGTLGNSNKVFNALIEAGAEMKSNTAGTGTVELIRASNLVCRFESAPDLDALCTFFTKGDSGRMVKGVASSENSWMIGFNLISAGAKKNHLSENVSEIRLQSLVCNLRSTNSESSCIFMQEQ
jgi:hypothetical protein